MSAQVSQSRPATLAALERACERPGTPISLPEMDTRIRVAALVGPPHRELLIERPRLGGPQHEAAVSGRALSGVMPMAQPPMPWWSRLCESLAWAIKATHCAGSVGQALGGRRPCPATPRWWRGWLAG